MNYELLTTENAPVKMWTKGVPVEADARQQLINTAKMPFIFKHIAVMPDVHLGKGSTIGSVIPTKGAIVLADFQTRVGSRVLLTLTYLGKPVPFGASATVVENTTTSPNTGIIGLEGELYLSGVPEQGELQVQWGEGAIQQCKVNFNLPVVPPDAVSTIRILKGACT